MQGKNRVLIIGLDGATFNIINPLVKEGKLPNLSRIMKRSSYGPLKSTIPPLTPCAWTSFATGKQPDKHGIFDFWIPKGNNDNRDENRNVNRTFNRSKSLWRVLTEAGKKSIVVDVPLTFPPEEINGIIVSRIMALRDKVCTYPESLYAELKEKGYIPKEPEKVEELHKEKDEQKSEEEFRKEVEEKRRKFENLSEEEKKKIRDERLEKILENFKKQIDENISLAKELTKRLDWDFFIMVFMQTDQAGHTFWFDKERVKRTYIEIDRAVGELFGLVGEKTVKFIISDHGFTDMPFSFYVNEWLHEKGLLAKTIRPLKDDVISQIRRLKRRFDRKEEKRVENKGKFEYTLTVDYKNTKAFLQSGTSYGLRLNLKGREPEGVLTKEDYDKLKDRLVEELKNLKSPFSQRRLFQLVSKKEDIHKAGFVDIGPAPDIIFLPEDMKWGLVGSLQKEKEIFKRRDDGYGFHHTDGILFIEGPCMRGGNFIGDAHIVDIAPTVLHVLDVPIPQDMDGKILRDSFSADSYIYTKEKRTQRPSMVEEKIEGYGKEEERELREKLAALGYIG